ncbi:hypothetical protein BY458DRAFT_559206 [Sporodiniella umbellata]|nr:hypothetical protein BY458DRAFT_559205 [Sporodiniella umbellata]KAI9252604.1 hypothetical protein BY458DRAFT_559206 [Sporodiniella umbellata]
MNTQSLKRKRGDDEEEVLPPNKRQKVASDCQEAIKVAREFDESSWDSDSSLPLDSETDDTSESTHLFSDGWQSSSSDGLDSFIPSDGTENDSEYSSGDESSVYYTAPEFNSGYISDEGSAFTASSDDESASESD